MYIHSLLRSLYSLLILVILFASAATQAQSIDALLSNNINNANISENSSSLDDELAELAQEEEFLPVEEAYQLSVSRDAEGLKLSWVIADAYFLYGEQFRFKVGDQVVEASIPEGKVAYDPIFEKDVEKHYQFVEASIPASALADDFSLQVRSQGCADAGLCYPPQIQDFTVKGNNISAIPVNNGFNSFSQGTPAVEASTPITAIATASLATVMLMLVFAIAGGSILNLMPCVLPVLSLKALSLANSEQDHRRQGWAYTLGVVSTFSLIAALLLAVRAAGQSVGWGFQLQSPGFVTLLIYLFFIMGLSLSGFMTIGTRWMSVGQNLTQGNGLKQSYFTGVLAAVVASPCTAPFMAPALGFAITQPWFIALLIFAGLGLGMALPLLLLSYLPQLGKWLPQPGAWMETFKQALAFPLYLTAIWLLWVLSRQLGADAAIIVISIALLMLFVTWLGNNSQQAAKISTLTLTILALGMTWHSSQSKLVEKSTTSASEWEPYNEQRLSELRQQGRPVFINMTADWCITCLANEKLVFTDSTIEMMKAKDIVLVKGDWTNYDPRITQLLEKYDRGGVPLYLLFPAEPNAAPTVMPQILRPGSFKSSIEAI